MWHTSLWIAAALFAANADCEKSILETGQVPEKQDAVRVCRLNPSPQTQSCMVEILTQTKGKLRNRDFAEIYGFCSVDSSQNMRNCMVKGLDKNWNDPGYRGAKAVGSDCLLSRKFVAQRPKAGNVTESTTKPMAKPKK